MLEVKNLSKIYKSKERNEVQALEDINLTFNNQGLVFIIGPSGCGKSTLLNIIGGIDIPTSGEVLVDKKNIGTNEKSLDEYRNRYIGFVFQEFNLINDMTVYDNLSLVCYEEEKIKNVLKKVGLEGYEKRYPTELSGGQVQRVTIARALLKESRFLLADEPTGNLNNKMSIEIFELLKEISKEKLVIVVSHNEVLSRKYGDRIISIQDGQIIEDVQKELIKEEKEYIEETKVKKITNKTLLKLVRKNIIGNIRDFIITSIILLLCFACISISFSIISYDRVDVDIKNLKSISEIETVNMQSTVTYSEWLSVTQVNKIIDKFYDAEWIKNGRMKKELVEKVIDELNLEFIGEHDELKDDGIYISNRLLSGLKVSQELYYDKECTIPVRYYDESDLLHTYYKMPDKIVRIDGIIKDVLYMDVNFQEMDTKTLNNYVYNYFESRGTPLCLLDSIYDKNIKSSICSINSEHTKAYFNGKLLNVRPKFMMGNFFALTDKELKYVNEVNPNEVYISIDLYNRIFNENITYEYLIDYNPLADEKRKVKNYPKHIGEEISIEIMEKYFPDESVKIDKKIFKGVITIKSMTEEYELGLNYEDYVRVEPLCGIKWAYFFKNSIDDIEEFVKYASKIYLKPAYFCSGTIDNFEEKANNNRIIFVIICAILIVVAFLICYEFIKRFIKKKTKEIGILKSIGTSNKDIMKIYKLVIGIINIMLMVIIIPISIYAVYYLNEKYTQGAYPGLVVIYYKWWYALITIIFISITNFIASFVPLIKLKKMKAIQLVKTIF